MKIVKKMWKVVEVLFFVEVEKVIRLHVDVNFLVILAFVHLLVLRG